MECLSRQDYSTNLINIAYQKIPAIERDNSIRSTIDRGFQDHIIVRITQFRSPPKPELDRSGYRRKIIQDSLNLALIKSACFQVFGPAQDRFVFEHQWHGQEQIKTTVKSSMKELSGRSVTAPQASDNYIRV